MTKKKLNCLSGEIRLISAKELTKDLINEYVVVNGPKYVTEDGSHISATS